MSSSRALRFLFVIDPLASLNPEGDTTLAFMREAVRCGVDVDFCELHDLRGTSSGSTRLRATRAVPAGLGFVAGAVDDDACLDDYAIVWMRKDPPVDDLFLFACMLLDRHDRAKTLVLNDPAQLRVAHEKLFALHFPSVIPRQIVTSSRTALKAFFDAEGVAVLKPLAFMGGLGVMVFDKGDKNLKSAIDLLTSEGKRPAIAQQFLPRVVDGDKRVIVVDGEPVAALLRVPRGDDVRANLHVGGTAKVGVIDDDDRRICAVLAPELRARGLFFVGLDVIGGVLTEINVTSPTGVTHIDRLEGRTGDNSVAALVVTRALARYRASTSA